jgi:activator of 2-hydroxyglutaryl-CoA dehydratase
MRAIRTVVTAIRARNPDRAIAGGATTGSGRRLAQALLDAPLAIDEISCQHFMALDAPPRMMRMGVGRPPELGRL